MEITFLSMLDAQLSCLHSMNSIKLSKGRSIKVKRLNVKTFNIFFYFWFLQKLLWYETNYEYKSQHTKISCQTSRVNQVRSSFAIWKTRRKNQTHTECPKKDYQLLLTWVSILNELLQITTEIAFIIPGHQCFVSLADTYQQVLHKICSFEKDCINN